MKAELRKSRLPLHAVSFGSQKIEFSIGYRERKTLSISVHPDLSVSVSAPEGKSVEEIKVGVKRRAKWILKQRSYFSNFHPRPKAKRYVSGETFRYLGRQYRLKVGLGETSGVKLKNGYIFVTITRRTKVEKILNEWFREQAVRHFQSSLERCLPRFNDCNIGLPKIVVRSMSRRWGSCSKNGVITLNSSLVSASRESIDYVVIHELCHLLIANHSKAYFQLLESILPDWKKRKHRLESSSF